MKININGKNLHYKIVGEGEPVLFLNGMMMNTKSWRIFEKDFGSKFQMILLDLLDQGDSDNMDGDFEYTEHEYYIKEFLKQIGYESVHILGTSYGGEMAQYFTIKNPDMVKGLILVNTMPVMDEYLRSMNSSWCLAFSSEDMVHVKTVIYPLIYSKSYFLKHPKEMRRIISRKETAESSDYYERIIRTLLSTNNFDVRDDLDKINVPTLIVGADEDGVAPPVYQRMTYDRIKGAHWIEIKGTGHMAMYEKKREFISIILGWMAKC